MREHDYFFPTCHNVYKDFSFLLPSFLSCIEIVFGVIPSGKSVMYKKAKPKIIHKIHTWTNGGTLCSFDVRSLTHGTTPSWSGIVTSSIPSLVSLTALWTTLTPLRPTWPASTHWKIRFVQFNWDTENCGEHAQNIAMNSFYPFLSTLWQQPLPKALVNNCTQETSLHAALGGNGSPRIAFSLILAKA